MTIKPIPIAIDHVVMSVRDPEAIAKFYGDVLGVPIRRPGGDRYALRIGSQKLNLHQVGAEIEPHALAPTCGALDVCLLTDTPLGEIEERLDAARVEIVLGPVIRPGAAGPLESIYIRDPDGNLVEIARSRA